MDNMVTKEERVNQLRTKINSSLPKYISNFPYFTDIPAHSLVK